MSSIRTKKTINEYLRDAEGVIHVGANVGQEAKRYHRHGLNVYWIEPIPYVFNMLENNIRQYPKQEAHLALVADTNDQEYKLHIANNTGASSSIYDLGDDFHRDHPSIHYTETTTLNSVTLPTILEQTSANLDLYNVLVIDTQGSELLVLQGAKSILDHFKYIRVEATDFQLYKDSCVYNEINAFLQEHGFEELYRFTSESTFEHDIVYQRT